MCESECVKVSVCVRERVSLCACVCVCVREREREIEREIERERVCVCVRERCLLLPTAVGPRVRVGISAILYHTTNRILEGGVNNPDADNV